MLLAVSRRACPAAVASGLRLSRLTLTRDARSPAHWSLSRCGGECAVDARQAALAAENGQRVEQAEADRLAGDGDAHGVDDVADLDALGRDELVRQLFELRRR